MKTADHRAYAQEMRIQVLLFGIVREAIGRGEEQLLLPDGATAAAVLDHYRATTPGLGKLWSAVALSVNEHYAPASTPLAEGDLVALLPPVSGGAPFAALTREPIDVAALLAEVKAGPDGAVVVFDGIVRNNTRGRQTAYLEYESYESMALGQMESLASEAVTRFGVREARIVHRLGRLQIGETSVLILVASAHRGAAFDACRWIIDTLKQTVPVWKKEHFVDGAVWADGEPFPEHLTPYATQGPGH